MPILSIDSFYGLCQGRQEGFGYLFRGVIHKGIWERAEISSNVGGGQQGEGQRHIDQRQGMVGLQGRKGSVVRKFYGQV